MTASPRRLLHPLLAIAVVASLASGQAQRPPQDPSASKRPPYEVIEVKPDGAPESGKTATRRSGPAPAEKFDAPKAKLWRLIVRGVLDDLLSGGRAQTTMVVLLLIVFFQGLPMFLAWDFARGAGRRTWLWLSLTAVGSWLVLPVIWITSTAAHRGADDGSTRREFQGGARAQASAIVARVQLRPRRSVGQRVAPRRQGAARSPRSGRCFHGWLASSDWSSSRSTRVGPRQASHGRASDPAIRRARCRRRIGSRSPIIARSRESGCFACCPARRSRSRPEGSNSGATSSRARPPREKTPPNGETQPRISSKLSPCRSGRSSSTSVCIGTGIPAPRSWSS